MDGNEFTECPSKRPSSSVVFPRWIAPLADALLWVGAFSALILIIKTTSFKFSGIEITWQYLFTDLADPRTSEWPLMKDPIPMVTIVAMYQYFVLRLGPALMVNRKPFHFRSILITYNLLQVLLSCYIFFQLCYLAWFRDYNWLCQPVDYSSTPVPMQIAEICYVYFVAKLSELSDTVFFVLRKKDRQITFLHLYHHTVMPIASWGGVKYFPGGNSTFIGMVNSFVHIVMYSYYLLTALRLHVHKYIWWKKYVTTMQLIQFCVAFIHSSLLCFIDCGYPRFTLLLTLPNSVFFYFLFVNFYKRAYETKWKYGNLFGNKEDGEDIKNSGVVIIENWRRIKAD